MRELLWRERWGLRGWELPLLGKELVEQAQRGRTYWMRVLLAGGLYLWVILTNRHLLLTFDPNQATQNLGQGNILLNSMFWAELFAIYVCLPAMSAGAIASEKEANTLSLLFVTRLRPWTIVLEKYLSRLWVAAGILVLAIPCMTVAYPLGGVRADSIVMAIWSLMLTAAIVIAVSLFASAWCRSTAGAVVMSYLLNLTLMFGPWMGVEFLFGYSNFWNSDWGRALREMFPGTREAFLYPFSLYVGTTRGLVATGFVWNFPTVVFHSLPMFLQILYFLWMTRLVMVRRAEGQGTNRLRRAFLWLDGVFKRMNENRVTRGMEIIRSRNDLPESHPIAWRETSRGGMSKPTHLIRLWLGLIFPVAFLFLVSEESQIRGLIAFLYAIYLLLTVLALGVKSATLIPAERSRQTLEVLLATPTGGRELIVEKMKGVWRLYFVLVSVVVIVVAMMWWVFIDYWKGSEILVDMVYAFPLVNGLILFVDIPLIIWLCVLVGLWNRSPGRSVLWGLGIAFAWGFLPPMFVGFSANPGNSFDPDLMWIYPAVFLFPTLHLYIHEFRAYFPHGLESCVWYFGLGVYWLMVVWGIRWWVLRNAARWLGRLEGEVSPEVKR